MFNDTANLQAHIEFSAASLRLDSLNKEIAKYNPHVLMKSAALGRDKGTRLKLAALVRQRELEKCALFDSLFALTKSAFNSGQAYMPQRTPGTTPFSFLQRNPNSAPVNTRFSNAVMRSPDAQTKPMSDISQAGRAFLSRQLQMPSFSLPKTQASRPQPAPVSSFEQDINALGPFGPSSAEVAQRTQHRPQPAPVSSFEQDINALGPFGPSSAEVAQRTQVQSPMNQSARNSPVMPAGSSFRPPVRPASINVASGRQTASMPTHTNRIEMMDNGNVYDGSTNTEFVMNDDLQSPSNTANTKFSPSQDLILPRNNGPHRQVPNIMRQPKVPSFSPPKAQPQAQPQLTADDYSRQAKEMLAALNAERRMAGGEVSNAQQRMAQANELLAKANKLRNAPGYQPAANDAGMRLTQQLNSERSRIGGEVANVGSRMQEISRANAARDAAMWQAANARYMNR